MQHPRRRPRIFSQRPQPKSGCARRCACTGKNDGQCYFCAWFFYRLFCCRQLRNRIRRLRRSVTASRERRFFTTTAPRVMELMDEGMEPASVALKHSVPDLTLISQRSGGKFPYQRVKEIIEGKEPGLLAHGDREMPIWGPIFHEVESDQDWGEVRLDAITKHMEAIQQK